MQRADKCNRMKESLEVHHFGAARLITVFVHAIMIIKLRFHATNTDIVEFSYWRE